MSTPLSSFNRPTLSQAVLLGLILFCCTVDASRAVSIMGVSGLGAGTFACCGAVWVVWLIRPVLPGGVLGVLLPLMLFILDALGTLFWYKPGMDGVQLTTILLTFIAVLMVTTRETHANPALAPLLFRAMMITSVMPVAVCFLAIYSGRLAGDTLNLTRPFALYTLCIVAVSLATWLGDNRPWPPGAGRRPPVRMPTLIPLAWALIVAYVVLLGLSRTALVGILLMIPLSIALRGNLKSLLMSVLTMAAGGAGFFALLYTNRGLYNRFFHEDAHMKFGGVAINGTGRTQIWKFLFDTIGDDWIFGKGISASEDIIKRMLPSVGQPHNDYLRIYYDEGVVGLSIWLIFILGITYRSAGNLRKSVRFGSADYPTHLAALLALAGVLFSMLTDNSIIYTSVMVPLAMLIGCSLGTAAAAAEQRDMHMQLEESFQQLQAEPRMVES